MGVWAEVYDFQAPPCAGPARRSKQIVPTAESTHGGRLKERGEPVIRNGWQAMAMANSFAARVNFSRIFPGRVDFGRLGVELAAHFGDNLRG